MLIAHIGEKDRVGVPHVAASGDVIELAADVVFVLRSIHSKLEQASPEAGVAFRDIVQAVVGDNDGPAWTMPMKGVGFIRLGSKEGR